ncbi:MAG TPA: RnfABCDGE type electron transport complex subunit D [Tepidisphaeraceae bacterium]|nr:RnfABCDGE type electron transport complex subunit D [Tepidisphaeraceae bacterium]
MSEAAPARPVLASPVPRGEIGVSGFYLTHFLAAVFPLTAGLLLYGWRAAAVVAGVIASAAIWAAIWRRIGPRGRMIHYPHALWFALLLALMLPAHLAQPPGNVWAIIAVAGLLLVILLWISGGLGGGHLHPVLATYLLLVICFGELLAPHRILNRSHLLTGDLFRTSLADARAINVPWIARRHSASDADDIEPAAERLTRYTSGHEIPQRKWLPLQAVLRDSLPPLEDFIVAGQPGAIGVSSVVAVIIGGLFLLYRGIIDYRIPLLSCIFAYLALLILPIPAVITEGPQWRWAAFRSSAIGWSVDVTFVNYEIMASPLIFTAFFLATAPTLRPMTRRGRTIYAIVFGILSAVLQLYVSVPVGPYVALLIASLLSPELDRWFKARPLI